MNKRIASAFTIFLIIIVVPFIHAENVTKIRWRVLRQLRDVSILPDAIQKLNNSDIRVAGYMVPLESNETGVIEFLLVPISGQCIHIPPPPSNQMIYVTMSEGKAAQFTQKSVMVWGKFSVGAKENKYGRALYRIDGNKVLAY